MDSVLGDDTGVDKIGKMCGSSYRIRTSLIRVYLDIARQTVRM